MESLPPKQYSPVHILGNILAKKSLEMSQRRDLMHPSETTYISLQRDPSNILLMLRMRKAVSSSS